MLTPKARALLDPKQLIDMVTRADFFDRPKSDAPTFEFADETGTTRSFGVFDLEMETEFALDKELKRRMFLAGINIVGNATDLSNYLLFDIGQPTHFFAHAKVTAGNSHLDWSVRRLNQAQGFRGLGQLKKTTLPAGTAVIANREGQVLALPGISGAAASKIENDTRLVVEIANFASEEIARQAFALKYRSEAAKVWMGQVNRILTLLALVRLRELVPAAHLSLVGLWGDNQLHSTLEPIIQNYARPAIPVEVETLARRLDSRPLEEWGDALTRTLERIGTYDPGARTLAPEPYYSNLASFADVFEDVSRPRRVRPVAK